LPCGINPPIAAALHSYNTVRVPARLSYVKVTDLATIGSPLAIGIGKASCRR
jgi:hypothetical protein